MIEYKLSKAIKKFIEYCAEGNPCLIEDGEDWVKGFLTHPDSPFREVIEAARTVTGHPIPARAGDRRPGDPPTLVAGSERIRRELGWSPRYPDLRDIVQSAWDWHRAHPHGYDA